MNVLTLTLTFIDLSSSMPFALLLLFIEYILLAGCPRSGFSDLGNHEPQPAPFTEKDRPPVPREEPWSECLWRSSSLSEYRIEARLRPESQSGARSCRRPQRISSAES